MLKSNFLFLFLYSQLLSFEFYDDEVSAFKKIVDFPEQCLEYSDSTCIIPVALDTANSNVNIGGVRALTLDKFENVKLVKITSKWAPNINEEFYVVFFKVSNGIWANTLKQAVSTYNSVSEIPPELSNFQLSHMDSLNREYKLSWDEVNTCLLNVEDSVVTSVTIISKTTKEASFEYDRASNSPEKLLIANFNHKTWVESEEADDLEYLYLQIDEKLKFGGRGESCPKQLK